MADETISEPLFPSRLTTADLAQIEAQAQQTGGRLLAAALAAQPSRFSTDHWMQQASEWATQDEELKVRLFRLVDCMPMLDDPAALDRLYRVSGIGSKAGGADYLLQFTVPRTVTENTLRAHPTVRRRSAARMRGGQGRAAVDRAGFLADGGGWRWRRRSARIAWPQDRSRNAHTSLPHCERPMFGPFVRPSGQTSGVVGCPPSAHLHGLSR